MARANEDYLLERRKISLVILCGGQGRETAKRLVTITDRWLQTLWEASIPPNLRTHTSLHATGGYGRKELAFESDLDVLIALHDPDLAENPEFSLGIERLMAWTRHARARFSHAVRTEEQVGPALLEDLRTAVALLDLRPLQGPTPPAAFHRERVLAFLRQHDRGRDVVAQLFQGHRQRVARHGETVFLLEPDVKSGEGGLRDLNYLAWAATLRWNLNISSETLDDVGWSLEEQAEYLQHVNALLTLRNRLHLLHGRKHERLSFRDQEALIRWPPSDPGLTLDDLEHYLDSLRAPLQNEELRAALNPDIEAMMAHYYRRARRISTTTERGLRRWASHREPAQSLDPPFVRRGEELDLLPDIEISDALVFDALDIAAQEDLLLDPRLEERMEAQIQTWPFGDETSLPLRLRFRDLLVDPNAHWRTSQRMLELGILTRFVPEFEPLICHVQHDLYHVYTTDIHSLKCLEASRELLHPDRDHRWPFFAHIASQIEDVPTFLLASLFHDIGKNRGGGHSEIGATFMESVAPRLDLAPDQVADLVFLIRHHLDLSTTSRRRDISDPAIIEDLARSIKTLERLNQLTALTCCDMATVGPEVMNDWNASLLSQLYHHLHEALEFGLQRPYRQEPDQREKRRQDLVHQINLHAKENALYTDAFIQELPLEHLLDTDLEALFRQYQTYVAAKNSPDDTAVSLFPLADRGVTEVIVCAPDRPGTLARIAGAIASTGINIMAADIVTTSRDLTLDIFHIAHFNPRAVPPTPPRHVEGAHRLERISRRITDVLAHRVDVEELLIRRRGEQRLTPRQIPSVPTEIRIADNVSDHYTVLEVHTQDHLGLLYTIANSLLASRVNTRVSRVDSIGNRAIDTFYIEEWDGTPLSSARISEIVRTLEQVLHQHSKRGDT